MIIDILVILLAMIGLLLASFVLLPIVVDVEVARPHGDVPRTTLRALVAPWAGALAAVVTQTDQGWHLRVFLLGKLPLYRRYLASASASQDDAKATPATAHEAASTTSSPIVVTPKAPGAASATPAARSSAPTKSIPDTPTPEATPRWLDRLRATAADILPWLPPSRRLLRRLLRIVGLRHLQVDAVVGLQDAAATGRLYGQIQAISGFLPPRFHVNIETDFTRVTTRGQARLRLHLYLGRLLTTVIRFAFSAAMVWLQRWWRLRATRTAPGTG